MVQAQFALRVAEIVKKDPTIIGLAVAGSWITNEIDTFSDLDLILVTRENVTDDKARMIEYAKGFGNFLSGFTGEHVNEPRVLICLYDDPLLHIDIKFLTIEEFRIRIETPIILADTDEQLQHILQTSIPNFPYPDYQWIEDRFWIWIHYALLKIGRGELFEALEFISYVRFTVLGPLLHIKNGNLPKGVRKIEAKVEHEDLKQLKATIAAYDKQSLMHALEASVTLYSYLRQQLFDTDIVNFQTKTEERVMVYLQEIKSQL
jgi:hypothetical protein